MYNESALLSNVQMQFLHMKSAQLFLLGTWMIIAFGIVLLIS